MRKLFVIFFIFYLSGCLQEPSYIENYPLQNNSNNNTIDIRNNGNKNINKNLSNYNYDNNSQNDDIFWGGINDDNINNVNDLNIKKEYKNHHNEKIIKNKDIDNKFIKKHDKNTKDAKNLNIKNNSEISYFQSKKTKQIDKNIKINKNPETVNLKDIFIKPVDGEVIVKFKRSISNKVDDSQEGISFKAKTEDILSSYDGRVIYIDNQGDSGKTIIIKFENGLIGSYVFFGDILVSNNSLVKKKQKIGKINLDSGKNILYFTLRNNGKLINPEDLFVN
jgi:septal ring factor EnvC (AmiA/AmiB activator)